MIGAKTLFIIIGLSIVVIIAIVLIARKKKGTTSSKPKSKPRSSSSSASSPDTSGPSGGQMATLAATGGAAGIIGFLLYTRTGNILLLVVAGLFIIFILFIWYFWANMANGFSKLFGGVGTGLGGLLGGLGSGSSGKKPLNKNSYRYKWLKKRNARHMRDGSYKVYNGDHWESWWYDPTTGKWSVLRGLPSWETFDIIESPDGTKTYVDSNTGKELLVVTPEQQEYTPEWYGDLKQREADPLKDALESEDRDLF